MLTTIILYFLFIIFGLYFHSTKKWIKTCRIKKVFFIAIHKQQHHNILLRETNKHRFSTKSRDNIWPAFKWFIMCNVWVRHVLFLHKFNLCARKNLYGFPAKKTVRYYGNIVGRHFPTRIKNVCANREKPADPDWNALRIISHKFSFFELSMTCDDWICTKHDESKNKNEISFYAYKPSVVT